MAIAEKLQNMNLKSEPTDEDRLAARRRRDDFVAWLCGVLSGPGVKLPKQCQRSLPMGQISEWIKHYATHNEFSPSAMRRFLDGEFTEEVPIYIPKLHRKDVGKILDVLDIVETMARMMNNDSVGIKSKSSSEPELKSDAITDAVVDEFLDKNPPELYPDEKTVAKEEKSGNTPVEDVIEPEKKAEPLSGSPGAEERVEDEHDPYEKVPPEPKKLGRPPGSGKKKTNGG